ncbi:hypothetical protein FB451DRAFT_205386 [Mycena latifolia]|nr:hypothetical protein FB451DRAFT_205386 [Mycena latifolia]
MSFFSGCTNFEIIGGEFNEVKGNLNRFHHSRMSATAGSHNRDTGGVAWHGNAFRPAPSNTFHHQQDIPGRSQSHSAAFPTVHPRVFNSQNSGWAAPGPRPSGSMRALPASRTSQPEDELAAQIQHGARAREQSWAYQPSPPLSRDATTPAWATQRAHPSSPIPMSRPNNSSYRSHNSGDDMLTSSPEDSEAPSWPRPVSRPTERFPRAANTHAGPGPARTAYHPAPGARSSNTLPRPREGEDDASSSSSDSEDE